MVGWGPRGDTGGRPGGWGVTLVVGRGSGGDTGDGNVRRTV